MSITLGTYQRKEHFLKRNTGQDLYVFLVGKPVQHSEKTVNSGQFHLTSSLLLRFSVSDKTSENAKLLERYEINWSRSLGFSEK